MAIEAPISKFKKHNWIIIIAVLLVFAAWCVYDGYYNEEWIAEHTDEQGQPEPYLTFNMYAPYVLVPAALLAGVYIYMIKDKKIVATEKTLLLEDGREVPYDSIEKVDKTNFEKKGYFVLTYKDQGGAERQLKLDDRRYDNLGLVLDEIVAKIS